MHVCVCACVAPSFCSSCPLGGKRFLGKKKQCLCINRFAHPQLDYQFLQCRYCRNPPCGIVWHELRQNLTLRSISVCDHFGIVDGQLVKREHPLPNKETGARKGTSDFHACSYILFHFKCHCIRLLLVSYHVILSN